MKTLFRTLTLLAVFGVALCVTPAASAADTARVQATLILGSNDGGGVDPQLRQYERNLQRVLGFDTFRQQGSGTAQVSLPGSGSISIGGGHRVAVTAESAADGKLRVAARWTQGDRTYVNTTVVTGLGQPTVLVGPAAGSGKLILLIVAR